MMVNKVEFDMLRTWAAVHTGHKRCSTYLMKLLNKSYHENSFLDGNMREIKMQTQNNIAEPIEAAPPYRGLGG
jgi:hypothetical protein